MSSAKMRKETILRCFSWVDMWSKQLIFKVINSFRSDTMYSYLIEGYEDVNVFSVDLWRFANLIRDMAHKGEWKPVFQFLADEVKKQTFLLAYLNVTDYYITRTEEEMGKGFADIYLEPFSAKYPEVCHTYLIELKYIVRADFSEDKLHALLADAETQLRQYATDERVIKQSKGTSFKCLALVFCGWEMKAAEEYPLPVP